VTLLSGGGHNAGSSQVSVDKIVSFLWRPVGMQLKCFMSFPRSASREHLLYSRSAFHTLYIHWHSKKNVSSLFVIR